MNPNFEKALFTLSLALLFFIVSATAASAHGGIDQQYIPPNFNSSAAIAGAIEGQTFVPQGRDMVAVDLYISYEPPLLIGSTNLNIKVRQGPPSCPSWQCVISTQTVVVQPGTIGWQHIDLNNVVVVDPTSQYGIQVGSPSQYVRWFYGVDTYAPGMAYCAKQPPWQNGFYPNYDWSFVTYHQGPAA